MNPIDDAQLVLQRCDALADISEEPGRITRRFATPAMAQASGVVAEWMRAAGMEVRQDAVGNLIGFYPGTQPESPVLLIGSHLDTVRDAGRYDGPLGVLAGLALIERLHRRGQHLRHAIELLAFADEEGVRYHTAYLGSSHLVGKFQPSWLDQRDADGIRMADALRQFGGQPEAINQPYRPAHRLAGYVEVHIEQGPVLEAKNYAVGVVSAIQAQHRFRLTFHGTAGHAGTVPMELRRDALAAAAAFMVEAERYAQQTAGLVATVGQINASPGASNVIPGSVWLSLDVRHPDTTQLELACQQLYQTAHQIGLQRQIALEWQVVQHNPAVTCSPRLRAALDQALRACGQPSFSLPSGAGHDGVMLAAITEIVMLFVRCAGGISHNSAESVNHADVAVALDVLERFVVEL